MERPTPLKVMTRVMDAVNHLHESKGSTVRGILDFIRENSNTPNKNLTPQVHKALRNAVNAGLLRHKNGRYKALTILNPIPPEESAEIQQSLESAEGNIENHSESKSDPSRKVQKAARRRSQKKNRRKSRSRRRTSRQKRRRRRQDVAFDLGPAPKRRRGRHIRNDLFEFDPYFKENIENEVDLDTSPRTDRRSRSISIKSTSQSDLSGNDSNSDRESQKSYRHRHRSRNTPSRQNLKYSETKSRRSTSNNRCSSRQSQEREQNESQRDRNEIDGSRQDRLVESENNPAENEDAQRLPDKSNQNGSGSTF